MTGSLHEKNGKWQLVLYGAVGILFPNKETDNPQKKVCKWISSNLDATPKNKLLASKMLIEKVMDYEQQEKKAAERKELNDSGIATIDLGEISGLCRTAYYTLFCRAECNAY